LTDLELLRIFLLLLKNSNVLLRLFCLTRSVTFLDVYTLELQLLQILGQVLLRSNVVKVNFIVLARDQTSFDVLLLDLGYM
jgi:hypothetical protein